MTNNFYIATYESRSFMFEGAGITKGIAVNALYQALVKHSEQFKLTAPEPWIKSGMKDATVKRFQSGTGYRDGEKLS